MSSALPVATILDHAQASASDVEVSVAKVRILPLNKIRFG